MLSSFTLTGTLPTACVASVWNSTPRSRAIRPISRIGWKTPISLLACMTLIRMVWSVMAARSASRSIRPSAPDRQEGDAGSRASPGACRCPAPPCARWPTVMMWLPFSAYISATPLMARLSDSVAPLVKTISLGVAPIRSAICWRAFSTACSASQPKVWLRLAALPNFSREVGQHGLEHARIERRGGVVVHVYRRLHTFSRTGSGTGLGALLAHG